MLRFSQEELSYLMLKKRKWLLGHIPGWGPPEWAVWNQEGSSNWDQWGEYQWVNLVVKMWALLLGLPFAGVTQGDSLRDGGGKTGFWGWASPCEPQCLVTQVVTRTLWEGEAVTESYQWGKSSMERSCILWASQTSWCSWGCGEEEGGCCEQNSHGSPITQCDYICRQNLEVIRIIRVGL